MKPHIHTARAPDPLQGIRALPWQAIAPLPSANSSGIVTPFPANRFGQKVRNARSVTMDDVCAGICVGAAPWGARWFF
ncbi:MAG: hypothetical protein LBS70_03780 [Candidatus Accumulibacter sp.]|jgi:hypothetical protein|nr:hypothetical protein [Accumulibacter sp.]